MRSGYRYRVRCLTVVYTIALGSTLPLTASVCCVPCLSCRYARVTCSRLSYVGELGYELLIPAEHAAHVYDRLAAAAASRGIANGGVARGVVHAGLQAVNSLRLEKGFRDYGHDVDNTDGVEEVGLDFTCCMRNPRPFIGRDAVEMSLAKLAGRAPRKRLVQVRRVACAAVMCPQAAADA